MATAVSQVVTKLVCRRECKVSQNLDSWQLRLGSRAGQLL